MRSEECVEVMKMSGEVEWRDHGDVIAAVGRLLWWASKACGTMQKEADHTM